MDNKTRNTFIIAVLCPLFFFSSACFADKDKERKKEMFSHKNKEHDKKDKEHLHKGKTKKIGSTAANTNIDIVVFAEPERLIIRDYLRKHNKFNCPPGLAKKHNGCLPPGLAKKRYSIGSPLSVGWQAVPVELSSLLGIAPHGHRYVMVDKDVLLISEASKKVIDAVTLLSAVGD